MDGSRPTGSEGPEVEWREKPIRTATIITALLLVLFVGARVEGAIAGPKVERGCPATRAGIVEERVKTWALQGKLGLKRSRVQYHPIIGCGFAKWTRALWKGRREALDKAYERATAIPVGRAAIYRHMVDTYGSAIAECLHGIIRVENASYDPTIDFGWGHGNVHEAYGIPQANPGTKMRSAGHDWATNPKTQIRWMVGYVNSRYGGACSALSARHAKGWY